jgi:hypothetical protein
LQIIPRRIARSNAMLTWNSLKIEMSALEAKIEATPDKEADLKEVCTHTVAALWRICVCVCV